MPPRERSTAARGLVPLERAASLTASNDAALDEGWRRTGHQIRAVGALGVGTRVHSLARPNTFSSLRAQPTEAPRASPPDCPDGRRSVGARRRPPPSPGRDPATPSRAPAALP